MQLEPGTRIADRYLIEALLGQGGMGAVYRAYDEKFAMRVALKVTAASGASQGEVRARFVREARIGNLLGRTAGFVRAFDWGHFGDDGVLLFLALDLVDGARPLDLTSGDLPARIGRLIEAARVVAEAHRQGVIHRDLKPENFLRSPEGTLYLTDFGLAKVVGETEDDDPELTGALTGSAVAMGTPRYMAPEQFEDAKRVDARADVYALGVMLFLALTGQLPYQVIRPIELIQRHSLVREKRRQGPRPRDLQADLPPALDAICAHALAVDPARRVASADELLSALEAARPQPPAPPVASARSGPAPPAPSPRLDLERTAPDLPPGLAVGDAPGEVVNAKDGSVLLWVPPASYVRGAKDDDARADEYPVHTVHLTQGLFLAKHPVTWRQYAAYCQAVGLELPDRKLRTEHGMREAGDDHPVFMVSWDEAQAYCAWAGLRLPTESEWELAAKATDRRRYPWGDAPVDAARCLSLEHGTHGGRGTAPCGAHPAGAGPFGHQDLAGNVWEWVADRHAPYKRKVLTDPLGPATGELRVTRGGSWSTPADQCRTTARRMLPPILRSNNLGFRPARSVDAARPIDAGVAGDVTVDL